LAWSSHWLLIRLMDLGLINLRYLLILAKNWRLLNVLSDRWSDWRRSNLNWCFVLIWGNLRILVLSVVEGLREVKRQLTRFNPVILEFRKRVRFASDEFVDFAVVKRFPQNLVLERKIFKFGVLTAQKFGSN